VARAIAIGTCLWLLAAPAAGGGEQVATGRELLAPFKSALQQALLAGLEQGPVEAISVCRIEAPGIAAGLSVDGVRVGRSSHKLRNPANAPPTWVAPLLDGYRDRPDDREARTVLLGDGMAGYVEPIVVQPLCLACHGETLDAAVAEALATHYPSDRAIGYSVGDLRGVFWVEYPEQAAR